MIEVVHWFPTQAQAVNFLANFRTTHKAKGGSIHESFVVYDAVGAGGGTSPQHWKLTICYKN